MRDPENTRYTLTGPGGNEPFRVLLVDERRDAYEATGALLRAVPTHNYELTWCNQVDLALEAMLSNLHHVVLLNCHRDPQFSDALLDQAVSQSCRTPIILMTEELDARLDQQAIRKGASDYLVGSSTDAKILERAIRYAIDRKCAELQLARLAHYDLLTGVPNRILFRDRLQRAVERARRDGTKLALMFVDLDGFKQINDMYGHDAGDTLICTVARRLADCVRKCDSIARIGGDEFTIILEDVHATADVVQIARKVIEAINQPVQLRGIHGHVGCSLGIAVYPDGGDDADALLSHADMAMYQAKSLTGSTYRFYTEKMNAEAMNQVYLEADLRRGLRRNEFELFYQPRVSLIDGATLCVEALLRWNHPVRGVVMPDEFIAIAEEAGLIVPLGYWVVHQACSDLRSISDQGLKPVHASLNLSFKQFQDEMFVQTVTNIIQRSGLDAERLEFELTETALMSNFDETKASMDALRKIGPTFSLDDFGTGYSSFTHLQRLPIGAVKIDRSFVQNVLHVEDDATIVAAIISLAHKLNLQVIAEGAETVQQVHFLEKHRCDQVQGFVFSHPLSFNGLCKYLESERKTLREA